MSNKMNKPTRLRMILVRHIEEINPKADSSKITALEEDLVTHFRFLLHSAEELNCEVKCSNYIGDMD